MHKKKSKSTKREVRIAPQKVEIRKNDDDGTRSVAGYFATFGTLSHDLGFREVLQAGCFSESLRENPVACYRDHNAEMLCGKTQSGTLSVSEDSKGLAFRVKLPDTSYANDLVALMERGDATECSFSFCPTPDGESWSQLPNGEILRTITKAILFEGSILTGPPAAFPNTEANLRSCPADIRSKLKQRSDDDDQVDSDGSEDDEICPECGQPIPSEDDEDEDDEERQSKAHLELLKRRSR